VNGLFDHDEVKGRETDYVQNDHSNNSSSRLEEIRCLEPFKPKLLRQTKRRRKKKIMRFRLEIEFMTSSSFLLLAETAKNTVKGMPEG